MNTKPILLAYATRYGSTQEVAGRIGDSLRSAGLEVDIRPIQDVQALDNYDAVVLGAALYNARWHPDAHRFLLEHREVLCQRPLAIFALGPLSRDDAAMLRSRRQLQKELAKYSWLKPVALEMFVGKYDPSQLGFFQRSQPPRDNRDWNAIRSWADGLPRQLRLVEIPHLA